MISIRLLMMQRRVRAVLSPAHTRTYTGVIAILVESALPFTLLSISYLATYALNNPWLLLAYGDASVYVFPIFAMHVGIRFTLVN